MKNTPIKKFKYTGEGAISIQVAEDGKRTIVDVVDRDGLKSWVFHDTPHNPMLEPKVEQE